MFLLLLFTMLRPRNPRASCIPHTSQPGKKRRRLRHGNVLFSALLDEKGGGGGTRGISQSLSIKFNLQTLQLSPTAGILTSIADGSLFVILQTKGSLANTRGEPL